MKNLHWIVIITKKFEVLGYAGLCWPSMAFLAFVALDDFLKQKLAFADKIEAQLTCFQQSDVKTNLQMRSGILNQCEQQIWIKVFHEQNAWNLLFLPWIDWLTLGRAG